MQLKAGILHPPDILVFQEMQQNGKPANLTQNI